MDKHLAQVIRLPTIVDSSGIPLPTVEFTGPLPTKAGGGFRFDNIGDVISIALTYLYPLAGFLLFILLVIGGLQWLTASGDPKKIEGARNRVTYALLGFILLIVAFWVTKIVNAILSPGQPFF